MVLVKQLSSAFVSTLSVQHCSSIFFFSIVGHHATVTGQCLLEIPILPFKLDLKGKNVDSEKM